MMALLAAVLLFLALAPTPTGAAPRGRPVAGHGKLARAAKSIEKWKQRYERGQRSDDTVPQTLELLARALRAGASLQTAVDRVAADLPESGLSAVVNQVNSGLDMAEALDRWAVGSTRSTGYRRRGEDRYRGRNTSTADRQTVAALLVLGYRSGAAMASSLDRAAASIRQRRAIRDEIRALTAQTRISGIVVASAPVGFGAVIALADSEALKVLLTTPVGLVSLLLGIALECLGILWMSRLSRGVAVWA